MEDLRDSLIEEQNATIEKLTQLLMRCGHQYYFNLNMVSAISAHRNIQYPRKVGEGFLDGRAGRDPRRGPGRNEPFLVHGDGGAEEDEKGGRQKGEAQE